MISNNKSYTRQLVDSRQRSTTSWQHGSGSMEWPDKPAATTTTAKETRCLATSEGGSRTPAKLPTTTMETWDQICRRAAREQGGRA
ncbi:hypothetical protein GUJ93_ZPchr0015g6627 [Zizania palustris]|uniref:Uncharacterized protein n=1 Tax=Zizania palustris TaxID=103762 RepID=A0A8J5VVJ8_ZIZPA|nr:hypothetical protein GUJ93_ZPchr0015g6627 [Zizania palustris]